MKVAIVCGAPSTEMLAPFTDPDWEVWVLGNRISHYADGKKRIKRIFEIHDNLTEHGDVAAYKSKFMQLAKSAPVVVGEKFFDGVVKNCPGIEVFPFDEVEKLYGSLYLTSSPAYMIAYAILKGVKELAIYGVDLSISDHEYFWQRPCVEAWIGFAKGRGIKVTIPPQSHIGKSYYVEGRHWGIELESGAFSEESFAILETKHKEQIENIRREQHNLDIKSAMHESAAQVYAKLGQVARAVEAKVDVKSLLETTLIR